MENPWVNLRLTDGRYLLDMDRESIERLNSGLTDTAKLALDSIPEPFIGNPQSARVVMLLLNPGDGEGDRVAHKNEKFKTALFRNLHHESMEYPFYPLNPDFKDKPTAQWWRPRLRKLQEATKLDDRTLSERLIAIEWFPYHSRYSGLPLDRICESQRYTFQLAREMLSSKVVLRMRAVNHWGAVDPRFRDLSSLKNPRACYISERNTDTECFSRIKAALTTN
ncbi:MAG TPA: hypothetical protein VKR52_03425 [Terracidiphilus sp.]|nr:hypothetical protein [Terracidiphilus sp.]